MRALQMVALALCLTAALLVALFAGRNTARLVDQWTPQTASTAVRYTP